MTKILFDADKLDAAGAIGIARTLLYKGIVSEPLYSKFYTEKATKLSRERQNIASEFYRNLYQEINSSYQNGKNELDKIIQ